MVALAVPRGVADANRMGDWVATGTAMGRSWASSGMAPPSLDESERRDRELMEKHRNNLERLAETLLQEETLARDRIEALLSAPGEETRRTGANG
jgi:hypothetical protein